MAGIKEIRTKIKSVQNTRKITKAMEMVAASKMRKAQERMRAGRPYATKVYEMASHMMEANPEYTHPFLIERTGLNAVGIVVVSTDKGLCGGLNTNIMRLVLNRMREFNDKNIKTQFTALGNKGLGVLTRIDANVVSQEIGLGDKPELDRLVGAIKVQLGLFGWTRRCGLYRDQPLHQYDEARSNVYTAIAFAGQTCRPVSSIFCR